MDDADALFEQLLAGADTESEIGRHRAYRRCVRYAEEQLADSHFCNTFLLRAAERLGQPALVIPVVHNRVPVPPEAKLSFYYHDDEGPVLVGNSVGLRYLAALCADLALAPLPGENVVIEEGYPPLAGDSYGLTVYVENEEWFAAAEDGRENEFVAEWEAELNGRIVASQDVVALQLTGPVPPNLALSPQKLYRVHGLEPWHDRADVPRKVYRDDVDRVRIFSLVEDESQPLRIAFDLDDPDLNFYYAWHLEQFAAAE